MLNWDSIRGGKPLGRYGPWTWAVEFVRGCNLKCWHCPARIFPADGEKRFMSKDVWTAMFEVVAECTPAGRLELGQCGEPTLHPDLYELISVGREISPTTQIMMFTNGVTLMKGDVSYKDLFDAGLHVVYVDMYHPLKDHIEMAEASGAEWYKYDQPRKIGSKDHRMANTYYGDPDMKLIVLQDRPENRLKWRRSGRLSTFLNHLDWNASMSRGLVPVREPYERKCTIPMRFSTVSFEGDYTFCCIDFFYEAAGLMGNVRDGVDGFRKYWFGDLMQSIRRRLHNKDRAGVPYCSRCNCAFSKCDWTGLWPEGSFDEYWDGDAFVSLPADDSGVFADGWKKAAASQAALPSENEEDECLQKSNNILIPSTIAACRDKAKTGRSFGLRNSE